MSAIFGIIDFHEPELDPTWIRSMQSAMEHRGPDGQGLYEDDNLALGNMKLTVTPQSIHEASPLKLGQHVISADSRLNEREKLINKLVIDSGQQRNISDTELLVRSFQRWGAGFVNEIYGDFSLVIWDEEDQTVFVARDHVGVKPLLYHFEDGRFTFSTEMKALVQLPYVDAKVNEEFIKIHSTGYSTGHVTTAWENVKRLPPAHYLRITAEGIEEVQYWKPVYERGRGVEGERALAKSKEQSAKGLKEEKGKRNKERYYSDRLRELMKQAIVDRCKGAEVIGIPLSGGFDSSSIAALAASALRGTNTRIATVSSVLSRGMEDGGEGLENQRFNDSTIQQDGVWSGGVELKAKLKDERKYIDALLRMYPEIEAHYITPDDLSFTETLEENMERHYSPENYFYYLDDAINAKMQELGVKRVLSGYVGDTTVSNWGIDPVPYLIRQVHWVRAFNCLRQRGTGNRERGKENQRFNDSTIQQPYRFVKELIKAFMPGGLLMQYHLWKDKEPWGFEKLPVKWSEEEREFLLKYSREHYRKFTLNKADVSDQIWDMDTVHFTESFNTGPAHYGVEWAFPWVDRRIIEFLMELPLEYFEMGGKKRGLIREAMRGLLPEEILNRTDKQDYSPGYPLIFRREFDQIVSKFQNWSQTGLLAEWVDYNSVQRILNQWYRQEKKLTFDYKLFFIKNLFVFLTFIDNYKNKIRIQ